MLIMITRFMKNCFQRKTKVSGICSSKYESQGISMRCSVEASTHWFPRILSLRAHKVVIEEVA